MTERPPVLPADYRAARRSWGVASPHPAATDVAATVLASGGTAVDAAIAAAGVLAVVYPHNCSVGGDLIGLVRLAGGATRAVFGVGRSAGAIDVAALRQDLGERVPVVGPFSISVPGVVSGWQAMHELDGRAPLGELLAPAVTLAADGAAVGESLARALRTLDSPDPGLAQVFGPLGQRLGAGDVFVQPRLAETLAEVGADPECYYRGGLAERLVGGLGRAGSPITREDFARHRAVVGEPVAADGGRLAPRLLTAGLPSQGVFFAAMVEMAGQLAEKGYDLLGQDAALLARLFSEFSRIRDDLLCDPARSLGTEALSERVAEIDLFGGSSPGGGGQQLVAEGLAPPSGDTVAVVVHDGSGNSVSMLQSVFHSFGSHVLDPETGVLFHSRQSMFTLRPGVPSELGPDLMPPHTLCPVLVDSADGMPSLVLGTMGGRAQPQILAQVLLQLAAGRDATEAVSAPRLVVGDTETAGFNSVLYAERDFPGDSLGVCAGWGFDVRTIGRLDDEMGHAQVLRVGVHGVVDAASDPRSDGSARREVVGAGNPGHRGA